MEVWERRVEDWLGHAQAGRLDQLKRMHGEEPRVDLEARLPKPGKNGLATALMLACEEGHIETVQWLLSVGASLNGSKDIKGCTAFMQAMVCDTPQGRTLVRWLLTQGADVNTRTQSGGNLLFHAGWWGNLDCVKFLVMHGLNFQETNARGETPDQVIEKYPGPDKGDFRANQAAVVKFLREEAPQFKQEYSKLKSSVLPVAEAKNEAASGGKVMVSYCWAQQKLVLALVEKLKASGINVWVDVEDMKGSTLAAMADAVESSPVIIAAISRDYCESYNCNLEAEYAIQKRKRIIPVMLEKGFKPGGVIGIVLGAKLYHEYFSADQLSTVFPKLLLEVQQGLKHNNNSGGGGSSSSPFKLANPVGSPVSEQQTQAAQDKPARTTHHSAKWNSRQVADWLRKENVHESVVARVAKQHMDGRALQELWRREGKSGPGLICDRLFFSHDPLHLSASLPPVPPAKARKKEKMVGGLFRANSGPTEAEAEAPVCAVGHVLGFLAALRELHDAEHDWRE
eukprot:g4798.t1